jgi:hypothetical protein
MRTFIGGLVLILESAVMNSMGYGVTTWQCHDFAHSIICTYHRDILGLDTCIKGGIL